MVGLILQKQHLGACPFFLMVSIKMYLYHEMENSIQNINFNIVINRMPVGH